MNSDKQVAVYDNTVSARTYLSYISEQAGGFACIGRDGKLYIRTIGESIAELPLKYFQNFKWGDKFKFTRVRYEDGIQLFEKGNTTGNTIYLNQDNMYIVDQEQIDNIYNQLNGLEVYSFEGDSIIDPALDIGDLLLIDNKYVIYQGSSQYAGKFKASIKSKIQCKEKEETTSRKPSQKAINRRVQSQINQVDGTITQLVSEQTETNKQLSEQSQTIDSITSTIVSKDELKEQVSKLEETIKGLNQIVSDSGGNNIFYYAKEFWTEETDDTEANIEEYTDTDLQQNSISGMGYIVNKGTSKQKIQVKNDNYIISFKYKKLVELATGYILLNGTQYNLTATEWTEMVITENIDTSEVDFEIISDTDNAFKICDLMGSIGTEKQVWTQNPNETRTDTVKIGKGIQVNSNVMNTYTRIDADGNRTFNSATGEVVMEATDKGVKSKEVIANVAQIGGILVQEIDGQTWISSLL